MKPEAFKAARQAMGLTQAELAKLLGLSDGRSVRRYETGERPIPVTTGLLMQTGALIKLGAANQRTPKRKK